MIVPMALGVVLAAVAPSSSELTVYNQGFGLVKEVRSLNLRQGRQTVAIEDVASMIEPASVSIHSLTDPDSFSVFEQNYQFDLISPTAILNKSVGGRVRFVRTIGNQRDVLEGTLISAPTAIVGTPEGGNIQTYNGMVIRTDDGRIVLNPTGEVEVTEVPKGLISKPTLLWDIEAKRGGDNNVELSYLTQGMRWDADYVFTLGDANKADLQGWVTIDNQSGGSWDNAKLKLLAGDVQRARPPVMQMDAAAMGGIMRKSEQQFQEEGLFEYHLYTLQRPATVHNKEIKQISLLEGHEVPFSKRIIVDATRQFGRFYPGEGEIGTGDIKPQVRVEFVNDQKSGLGMPLPQGRVKVYQRDKSGSVQLLGEDNIDHTPKDEKISLVVGRSFDIRATRKRTEFQRINDHTVQESYSIEVRNHKDTPETVVVIERFWGDWKILNKSQEFVKEDSNTASFTVKLAPNETKTVTYTVRTTW